MRKNGGILRKEMKVKRKLRQIFCRHKSVSPYKIVSTFHNIQGETVFWMCDRCEKIVNTEFYKNEDYYRMFRE